MKKICLLLIYLLFFFPIAFSQTIYPTHWWTGMKNPRLSLLIRSDSIGTTEAVSTTYPGIFVKKIQHFPNHHYLQIDLLIGQAAKPGKLKFYLKKVDKKTTVIEYELKARSKENGKSRVQGVTSEDFIYLLMPDRFANGNPKNDAFSDLRDTEADRTNKYARHGGDIEGIKNHLDYIKELGATTIWCTPLMENNMPKMQEGPFQLAGFHGYWFTDHYKIDKRYGSNEDYRSLIDAAHQKGLKIIHDAVYNHVGLYHWMQQDPPALDWINQWPDFTPPNHRDVALSDPNRSAIDNEIMLKGWFVRHLPDLNLANPHVAVYLIQNAIWLVEEFGFDGFRVDTYKYCDEKFLNTVNTALLNEFPSLTTFVEAWGHDVLSNAYFVRNNLNLPFKHNAQGALDFPLCFAIHNSLTQKTEWTTGLNELYLTLAEDLVYQDPLRNCIFLDNHDMNRFFSVVGEDISKFKMGMALLLTLRGIPQLYYGDEILMKNFKNPTDQEIRLDFPGGFPGDTVNKFVAAGRTNQENEVFNYIKTLARFRKSSSALKTGKTMHFIPQNGIYVYFRYDKHQTVMCIMNTNDKAVPVDLSRFKEKINGFSKGYDVVSGTSMDLTRPFSAMENSVMIVDLKK